MNRMFGIDISKWQGNFDLARAVKKEGVQFVIIKCGGGDIGTCYKDKEFMNNYMKAKALGIPVGFYWYSKALTRDDAIKEAAFCYNLIKDLQFELPLYMDVEEKAMLALGKEKLSDVIITFGTYLEERRIFTGVYSSKSYFKSYMTEEVSRRFTTWVAAWGTKKPEKATLWQFGGETNKLRSNKICGKTVDQDYLYCDFMTTIKTYGFNGYKKR